MITATRLRIRRSLEKSGLPTHLVNFLAQQWIRSDEVHLHTTEQLMRRGLSRADAETLVAFGQKVKK